MSWRVRILPALYSMVLTLAILGPLLGPGYLLLRDAVSTPRSYLTDSALGLGDAAPRAVPQDALLAVVSTVVDGGLVVKLLLLVSLWLAGWGAAELVKTLLPQFGTGPQLIAVTVTLWNPYVAERLLQGHWSLFAGYAALPWTARAAAEIRSEGSRRRWFALAVCVAAAGLTPTGAILATLTAVVLVGRRNILGVLAIAAVSSAPWLLATAFSGAGAEADPAGVAAFAARSEPWLGTFDTLAGLGGIWNSQAVPGSRSGPFALVGTALLIGLVAFGVPHLLTLRKDSIVIRLLVLAFGVVLFGALAATAPGIDAGEWAAVHLPGAGLLRDTQKLVALAVPFYALAAASTCHALSAKWDVRMVTPALGLALMLALPDLIWGVGGALRPVAYPASWARVAAELHEPGDVAVLPAGMFRIFPYSGAAPVLDPAPRMLPRDVLQTGQLVVGGEAVSGEGTRAAEVEALLLAGAPPDSLAEHGVRWVLVEKTTPGPLGSAQRTLDGLVRRYSDSELALYEVQDNFDDEHTPRALLIAAHLMWVAVLAGGVLGLVAGVRRADQT